MKKNYLFVLLALLMGVTGVNAQEEPTYWEDNTEEFDTSDNKGQSEANPIKINSPEQLAYLAKQVNSGTTYANTYFQLTIDLVLSKHYWVPIGKNGEYSFQGHFDGNNKTISGLKIGTEPENPKNYEFTGLFGVINGKDTKASVTNLTLGANDGSAIQGNNTEGSSYTAALASCVRGEIEISGCANYIPVTGGDVTTFSFTGGLLGYCFLPKLTLIDCDNHGNVTGGKASSSRTGGLISCIPQPEDFVMKRCYNYGNITGGEGKLDSLTGGLISQVFGLHTLEECNNYGKVTGGEATQTYTGGLIGESQGTSSEIASLIGCHSEATITATTGYAGGLVGRFSSNGTATVTITDCHTTGSITGTATYAGGIAGVLEFNNDSPKPTVSGCTANMTSLEGATVHRIAGRLMYNNDDDTGDKADFFQPAGNYAYVAEPAKGQTWVNDLYGMDGANLKDDTPIPTPYYSLLLDVTPGIELYNLAAGTHTVEEGGHLQLQFLPEDRSLTAADVLFFIDGVETAFKDFGANQYFSYILNPIKQDHTILIALRRYTVTLPQIEGLDISASATNANPATAEEQATTLWADYGKPFTFTLSSQTLDLSAMKVFANGTELTANALRSAVETLHATSLQYTIDRVTGPIVITFEGINPTGNADIAAGDIQLRITNYELQIDNSTGEAIEVSVYTLAGHVVTRRTVTHTATVPLEPGVYIVRAGTVVRKVVI